MKGQSKKVLKQLFKEAIQESLEAYNIRKVIREELEYYLNRNSKTSLSETQATQPKDTRLNRQIKKRFKSEAANLAMEFGSQPVTSPSLDELLVEEINTKEPDLPDSLNSVQKALNRDYSALLRKIEE